MENSDGRATRPVARPRSRLLAAILGIALGLGAAASAQAVPPTAAAEAVAGLPDGAIVIAEGKEQLQGKQSVERTLRIGQATRVGVTASLPIDWKMQLIDPQGQVRATRDGRSGPVVTADATAMPGEWIVRFTAGGAAAQQLGAWMATAFGTGVQLDVTVLSPGPDQALVVVRLQRDGRDLPFEGVAAFSDASAHPQLHPLVPDPDPTTAKKVAWASNLRGLATISVRVTSGDVTAIATELLETLGPETPADRFTQAPTPTIEGTAEVGSEVTALPGDWAPQPGLLSYQWLRDGVPIDRAYFGRYTPVAADAGKMLSVRVTATRNGFYATEKRSSPQRVAGSGQIPPASPKRFGTAPRPTISVPGNRKMRIGKTLTARPGAWRPSPVRFGYQWLRNGKKISGATKSRYRLGRADRGTKISVRVTASKPGYSTAAKTSTAKRVPRA